MKADDIRRIAVIGAGIMGHSMAQEFTLASYDVALHARSEENLAGARETIAGDLKRLVGLGVVSAEQAAAVLSRIRTTPVLEEAARDADAVFETVFKDVALKTETEPSPLLKKMVDRGELGVKSGKGFYQWTPEEAEAVRHRIAQAF